MTLNYFLCGSLNNFYPHLVHLIILHPFIHTVWEVKIYQSMDSPKRVAFMVLMDVNTWVGDPYPNEQWKKILQQGGWDSWNLIKILQLFCRFPLFEVTLHLLSFSVGKWKLKLHSGTDSNPLEIHQKGYCTHPTSQDGRWHLHLHLQPGGSLRQTMMRYTLHTHERNLKPFTFNSTSFFLLNSTSRLPGVLSCSKCSELYQTRNF